MVFIDFIHKYIDTLASDISRLQITMNRLHSSMNLPNAGADGVDYEAEYRAALMKYYDADVDIKKLLHYRDLFYKKEKLTFDMSQAKTEQELAPILNEWSTTGTELIFAGTAADEVMRNYKF